MPLEQNIAVVDGDVIAADAPTVLGAGTDGTNARTVEVDVNRRLSIKDTTTGTLANGAETAVAGAAVSILAANANRKAAIIQNTGIQNIRVGVAGVTNVTGLRVTPGSVVILESPYAVTQELFAIREGAVNSTAFAMEIT